MANALDYRGQDPNFESPSDLTGSTSLDRPIKFTNRPAGPCELASNFFFLKKKKRFQVFTNMLYLLILNFASILFAKLADTKLSCQVLHYKCIFSEDGQPQIFY